MLRAGHDLIQGIERNLGLEEMFLAQREGIELGASEEFGG